MAEKRWDKFTKSEAEDAIAGTTDFVVDWMNKYKIRAGSVGNVYNLYRAAQNAVRQEWEQSRQRKPLDTDLE
jgi:hypothetical protein